MSTKPSRVRATPGTERGMGGLKAVEGFAVVEEKGAFKGVDGAGAVWDGV